MFTSLLFCNTSQNNFPIEYVYICGFRRIGAERRNFFQKIDENPIYQMRFSEISVEVFQEFVHWIKPQMPHVSQL